MTQMKNTIVAYRGGGYDGCFWEWNYCTFDEDGNFHNWFTSGVAGIEKQTQVTQILKDKDTEVYDLSVEGEALRFVDETNAHTIYGLQGLMQETFPDIEWMFTCDETEQVLPLSKCILDQDSFSSDGGIVVTAKQLICEDVLIYRKLGFTDAVLGLKPSLSEDDMFYGCYSDYYEQGQNCMPEFNRHDIIHAHIVFALENPYEANKEQVFHKIDTRMKYSFSVDIYNYDTLSENAQAIYETLVLKHGLDEDFDFNHL